jgi:hypothetical protein
MQRQATISRVVVSHGDAIEQINDAKTIPEERLKANPAGLSDRTFAEVNHYVFASRSYWPNIQAFPTSLGELSSVA